MNNLDFLDVILLAGAAIGIVWIPVNLTLRRVRTGIWSDPQIHANQTEQLLYSLIMIVALVLALAAGLFEWKILMIPAVGLGIRLGFINASWKGRAAEATGVRDFSSEQVQDNSPDSSSR